MRRESHGMKSDGCIGWRLHRKNVTCEHVSAIDGWGYADKNAHARGDEHRVSEYSMPCSLSTFRRVL